MENDENKQGGRLNSSLVDIDQQRQKRQVEDWVSKAQAGCMQSFETLYRTFEKRVYALCLRMSANESIAEELTQEAFVLAWRKLDTFRGDSQFGTWLYRLTSNTVISFFRSRKNMAFEPLEIPEDDADSSQDEKLMIRDLEQAIQTLPDKARLVLVLHDIEGFTHEEIGQQLNVTSGTCKAQLHRARQLLKTRLNQHDS